MAGMQLGIVKNGKFCFDGNWFELKFPAQPGKDDFDQMKFIMEFGHAYGKSQKSYTRSVLIASKFTWDKYIANTYAATEWGDLGWLYFYDTTLKPGESPAWAKSFKDYGHLLLHEYEEGKIAYLKSADPLELYAFFDYIPAPPEEEEPPSPDPDNDIPVLASGEYDVDLTTILGIKIRGTIKSKEKE